MKKTLDMTAKVALNSVIHKQLVVLYVFFILRSFLGNTFIGSIGTQLFVTAPLAVSLLSSEENE